MMKNLILPRRRLKKTTREKLHYVTTSLKGPKKGNQTLILKGKSEIDDVSRQG